MFWSKQPVQREKIVSKEQQGQIEDLKYEENLRLHVTYTWLLYENLSSKDYHIIEELYDFLYENYIQDNTFRFKYSKKYLAWILSKSILLILKYGIRIYGLITGLPVTLRVFDRQINAVYVDFFCIHKTLRGKNITQIVLREFKNTCIAKGYKQAIFNSQKSIFFSISEQIKYFHYPLNYKKLLNTGFFGPVIQSDSSEETTNKSKSSKSYMNKKRNQKGILDPVRRRFYEKIYNKPLDFIVLKPEITGLYNKKFIRPACHKDIQSILLLLNETLSKYKLSIVFDEEYVKFFFLQEPEVVFCYVITDINNQVLDMFSFYVIHSESVITKEEIKVAYMFYVTTKHHSILEMLNCCIVAAKQKGFDLFNLLDLMDNTEAIKTQNNNFKLIEGTGFTRFYMYNWRTERFKNNEIGILVP